MFRPCQLKSLCAAERRRVHNASPVTRGAEAMMKLRRGEVDLAMAEDVDRKRLKKKVLDRWENEGGRIVADPAGADGGGPKSVHGWGLGQPSGSPGNSAAGSPANRRKPACR